MSRRSLGITLVELVITVLMIVVLLAFGAPAMRDLIQNNRQATRINEMVVSLNLARASAVKHGAPAIVCISDGAIPPDCAGAGAFRWENGWIVFIDGDGNGITNGLFDANANGHWDAGEDWLLQTHEALDEGTTLRSNTASPDTIRYDPRGFSRTRTLRLCDNRGDADARGILIYNTGRPRLATDADNITCP